MPETEVKYVDDNSKKVTTDAKGEAVFTGLATGYYEIKETEIPKGYVFNETDSFYVKVDSDGAHLIVCDLSKPAEEWTMAGSETIVSEFALASDEQPAVVTVENTAGAALPNTGGPGAKGFMILGGLLTIGAAVLLIRRKFVTSK